MAGEDIVGMEITGGNGPRDVKEICRIPLNVAELRNSLSTSEL
jgi:hypothetical protein